MADKGPCLKNAKIFSLIRLKAQCKILPVRVDFCNQPISSVAPATITPSFNNDRAYFTPCFVLPLEKKYYQENHSFQKSLFEQKVQRSVQDSNAMQCCQSTTNIIMEPPNSNYCQICQIKFEDYRTHIQSKTHCIRSVNSEATVLIEQLCSTLRDSIKTVSKKTKSKMIHKNNHREQKSSRENKLNGITKLVQIKPQGSGKSQNFSTCIIQNESVSCEE